MMTPHARERRGFNPFAVYSRGKPGVSAEVRLTRAHSGERPRSRRFSKHGVLSFSSDLRRGRRRRFYYPPPRETKAGARLRVPPELSGGRSVWGCVGGSARARQKARNYLKVFAHFARLSPVLCLHRWGGSLQTRFPHTLFQRLSGYFAETLALCICTMV